MTHGEANRQDAAAQQPPVVDAPHFLEPPPDRGFGAFAKIDSRARIVTAALFAVAVVAVDNLAILAGFLAVALGFAVAARLPLASTLRRIAAIDLFILFSVLALPFTLPGAALFEVGSWTASVEGTLAAARIVVKATSIMLALIGLVGVMPIVDLGHALARLGVSTKLISLLLLTVRYVDVLHREQRRLRLAMKARAFLPRADTHTWRTLGFLVGMLLVRGFERAERILAAMKCRGFTGRFHAGEPTGLALGDGVFLAGCALLMATLVALDRL